MALNEQRIMWCQWLVSLDIELVEIYFRSSTRRVFPWIDGNGMHNLVNVRAANQSQDFEFGRWLLSIQVFITCFVSNEFLISDKMTNVSKQTKSTKLLFPK